MSERVLYYVVAILSMFKLDGRMVDVVNGNAILLQHTHRERQRLCDRVRCGCVSVLCVCHWHIVVNANRSYCYCFHFKVYLFIQYYGAHAKDNNIHFVSVTFAMMFFLATIYSPFYSYHISDAVDLECKHKNDEYVNWFSFIFFCFTTFREHVRVYHTHYAHL